MFQRSWTFWFRDGAAITEIEQDSDYGRDVSLIQTLQTSLRCSACVSTRASVQRQ